MTTNMRILLTVAVALGWACSARAQASGFDQVLYQGRLEQNGLPQDGAFDFHFEIVDQAGGQLWFDEFSAVQVYQGYFAVPLGSGRPFLDELWYLDNLYLQIQVRPTGSGEFTALSGRQQLFSVPFAQRSTAARDLHVTGALQADNGASITGDLSVTGAASTASQLVTGELQVGGPVTLGSTASVGGNLGVTGNLDVAGAVILRGRHDSLSSGSAPTVTTTTWDITTSRYRLTIGDNFANRSYPIPHNVVEDYCADEDGCRMRVGMTGWGNTGTNLATYSVNMSYDKTSGRYRLEQDDAASNLEAVDGDHGETNLTCPWSACCVLDYDYAAGAQDDNAKQLYLHWSNSAYNVATKKCLVIFED